MLDPTTYVDLSEPSLKGLAHVLKRRDLWPSKFEWDYLDCHHCAMGLAVQLWPEITHDRFFGIKFKILNWDKKMTKAFGAPHDGSKRYWFFWNTYNPTPENIAGRIEQYLKEHQNAI